MSTVRTRFAPSPTGYLHIGGLRTALYTYLFTRREGGVFILRIEDTDKARYVEGAVEKIYSGLRAAGLQWDEGPDVGGEYGPYIQSERMRMYLPFAERLVREKKAYYCFCDKEELDARRAQKEKDGCSWKYDKRCLSLTPEEVRKKLEAKTPYVIRQNVPESGQASFNDLIYGHISVDCSELDDGVLIKADGMPTYNFANVIDDHEMGITHVLRGNEYLASTPKYNLIYEALGWEKPVYIHLTPVMKDASRKLSKRHGDPSFEDLLEQGYLKEAIVNYIALVGWNPGDDREFFTLDELIKAFTIDGISKSPAIFDQAKLTWMNGQYIRKLEPEAFTAYALPWYERAGVAGMDTQILCSILQPRVEIFSQIPEMAGFLTKMDEDYGLDLYDNKKSKSNKDTAREVLQTAIPTLSALPDWTQNALHDALMGLAAEKGIKNGTVLWPCRIAMAGKQVTPGGAIEIAALLGRGEALRRLEAGLKRLNALITTSN